MLDHLRQRLRALERPALLQDGAAVLPLGVAEVDAALGGGLARGALHEIAASSEAHLPAATGFVAGMAQSMCAPSPRLLREGRGRTGRGEGGAIVWIAEDLGQAESGVLYGPGLDGCGIPPERLLTVTVAHRRDLLWAMEEALRCRSAGVVIGEMRAGSLDGVAVRRLSLAAAESGALALLLRTVPPEDASTAATRWIVGAALQSPLIPAQAGIQNGPSTWHVSAGSPLSRGRTEESIEAPSAFTAHLVRNRRGPLGSWILTWSEDDGFAAHAQPLAAPLADRPHRAVA
jgi:protein ImuA